MQAIPKCRYRNDADEAIVVRLYYGPSQPCDETRVPAGSEVMMPFHLENALARQGLRRMEDVPAGAPTAAPVYDERNARIEQLESQLNMALEAMRSAGLLGDTRAVETNEPVPEPESEPEPEPKPKPESAPAAKPPKGQKGRRNR